MSFLSRFLNPRSISESDVDPDALSVLRRLNEAGYTAYLVGGGVRDLLLGRTPKDFDVVTDARPNQIRSRFRNSVVIGRRFKLALIFFGRNREKQIETATFRREPDAVPPSSAGAREAGSLYQASDNEFGTPEEDAYRRDFTVNALYWDPKSGQIVDYTGGLKDLDKKVLRCIGDPNVRFREDPVRMLRAVRLSTRLGFTIHTDSLTAIRCLSGELAQASKPRLFEELLRLFTFAKSEEAFRRLYETGLMDTLLPYVHDYISATGEDRSPLWKYLAALDAVAPSFDTVHRESPEYVQENAIRLAVLLAPLFRERREESRFEDAPIAAETVLSDVIVRPFMSVGWRVPRALCEDTAAILASLETYRKNGAGRNRLLSRSWFNTALRFWHIVAEAEGDRSARTALEEWDRLFLDYLSNPHPARRGSYIPSDPDRVGREGFPGDVPEDRDNAFADPPRKHRHRRKPRHRRHGGADAASAVHAAGGTPL